MDASQQIPMEPLASALSWILYRGTRPATRINEQPKQGRESRAPHLIVIFQIRS